MKKTTMRAGLTAALALALAGVGVSAAIAADTITPDSYFTGTIYLANANDGTDWTQSSTGFEDQVIAMVAAGDNAQKFPIPAGATGVYTFVSPRGSESTTSTWNAKAPQGLTDGGVWLPNVSLTNQGVLGGGTPNGINAVKAAGGDYSLGVAFTSANGVTVVPHGLYYAHIHVTAGTGAFTIAQVTDGGTGPVVDPPTGGTSQGLSAEVTTPPVVDGVLSLVAPATATSTIGSPTIVNGLSTSTGALGQLTVQDGRAASKPGWTLTTTGVTGFVNGGTTIGKQQLGLAPKNVSGVPTTLGTAQVAGTATYPSLFAQLPAGSAGDSVLDADLTFVAPTGSPAGTYTSTLTVTLVSK